MRLIFTDHELSPNTQHLQKWMDRTFLVQSVFNVSNLKGKNHSNYDSFIGKMQMEKQTNKAGGKWFNKKHVDH